ncbi:lysozyme inhibitor LprI family protein [Massilia sp. BSC265]|uniref:lysozyme inhibitor LprI family protein n=1 Tax=Massilia sp. BSC265 TaxID=1549812 RepID=UPI00068D64DF|nr:lysozyme inhibitor LprI family protein [Massilia sp. BSC265]
MLCGSTPARRYNALKSTALAAAFVLAAGAAGAAAPADTQRTAWVLAYEGQSSNSFVWDRRAKSLVASRVPATLSGEVLRGIGGPPDPVLVTQRRYLAVSGCVAHSCPDKGFFWIDAGTGIGLGAYYSGGELRLGSNAMQASRIPAPAQLAVTAWLRELEINPVSVQFVSRTGKTTSLPAAHFTPAGHFRPSSTGPSFDCRKASTRMEKAVCANASLSMQDLELGMLVKQVRHGHATVGARDELRALQRRWLQERDARCIPSTDLEACLASQYRAQYERIGNWVPSGRPM